MSDPVPPLAGGDGALVVTERIVIPRGELQFRATRAGGPGGQHVNTSSTRVELLWNPLTSQALDDAQRQAVRERLQARLDAEGNVRVVARESRSQLRNREQAEARLAALVRDALRPRKVRRATKPPRRAAEARLEDKRRRSERKRDRRDDY